MLVKLLKNLVDLVEVSEDSGLLHLFITFSNLLQIWVLFLHGFNGEVVPNKCTTFSRWKKSVVVEDIQGPILKTIYYLLDIYLENRLSQKLVFSALNYIISMPPTSYCEHLIKQLPPCRDRKCQQRNPHEMFHLLYEALVA